MKTVATRYLPLVSLLLGMLFIVACGQQSPVSNTAETSNVAPTQSSPVEKPSSPPAGQNQTTLKKFNVGYSAMAGSFGGMFIAQDKGFFKEYGLDVPELKYVVGTQMAAALVSGEIDMAGMAPSPVFVIAYEGADATTVASVNNRMPYTIVAQAEIKEPSQLAGKKIGITQMGDAPQAAMNYLLNTWGVPKEQVTYLASGGMPQRVAAFETRAIDVTLLTPLYVSQITTPYNIVSNPWKEKVKWLNTVVAIRKSAIANNKPAVTAALKAIAEGFYFGMANPTETKAILAKWLKLTDDNQINQTYEDFKEVFVPDLRPDPETVLSLIKYDTATTRPDAVSKGPSTFTDLSLLDELSASGFFNDLAKKYAVK